jgi:hypothetical protein
MKKSYIIIFVFFICISSINSNANETPLTKLEDDLLKYVIESMQSSVVDYYKYDDQIKLFEHLNHINSAITSLSYAMVLSPDGKIIAHNDILKLSSKVNDEATKKVLDNRDESYVLIQNLKLDNRDVLEISLPVYSVEPRKYLGAVRLGIYLN